MLSNCSKLHPPSIMASLPLFCIPPFFQSSSHSFPRLHSSFSSLSRSPLDVSLTMRQAVLAFPPHPSHPPPRQLSLSLSPSFSSLHLLVLSRRNPGAAAYVHSCWRGRERERIVCWFNPRSADRDTDDAQHLLHHSVHARSTLSPMSSPQHYFLWSPIS